MMGIGYGRVASSQQTPSENEAADRLLQTLPPLVKHLMAAVRQDLPAEFSIGDGQFRILHMLNHRDYTIGDLAECMEVRTPTISRMIDALVERGYVARRPDVADRRRIWLQLTPMGRELAQGMETCFRAAVARFLQPLGPDDRAAIIGACNTLEALLMGERTEQSRTARPA